MRDTFNKWWEKRPAKKCRLKSRGYYNQYKAWVDEVYHATEYTPWSLWSAVGSKVELRRWSADPYHPGEFTTLVVEFPRDMPRSERLKLLTVRIMLAC